MIPGTYNLEIYQGATFNRVFVWYSDVCCGANVAGANKLPVDLTNYTAAMQIRAFALATTVEYDATDNLTLGGQAGTIALSIPSSATADFTWWSGVYSLLLTDSSGNVTALLGGTVTVAANPTIPSMGGTPIQTDSGLNIITDSGEQLTTSS